MRSGRAEILEAVHAQVADTGVDERAHVVWERSTCPPWLTAAMRAPCARRSRRIPWSVSHGSPGMQSHANPDRAVRERALAVRGGGDRIGSWPKATKSVTLRVHLDAFVVGKRPGRRRCSCSASP